MIYNQLLEAIKQKGPFADLLSAIVFGLLAALFGHVYLFVADYQHAVTDLREIPLLIAVVYIRNPLYLLLICLLCAIDFTDDIPYLPTVIMHIVPVFLAWISYQWFKNKTMSIWTRAGVRILVVLIYYTIILFPCFVLTYELFGLNDGQSFFSYYGYLLSATQLEVPSTILVTSIYMMQRDVRKELEYTNQHLEKIVKERTAEIELANIELKKLNEDLYITNEGINVLNENLEAIVKERTEKIREHLDQLSKYAYMNSHEVRGPLARVMGLVALIQQETDPASIADLIDKLIISSNELDGIVRRMNRLLDEGH